MLNIEDFINVGFIAKTHGIEGNVVLKINDSFPDETYETDFVFIEIDGGLVPFKLIDINLRNNMTALLKLEDMDTDDLSKSLVACPVFFSKKDISSNDLDESVNIEGYMLVDEKYGKVGLISEILNYKVNKLIQIYVGKKEILIPFSDELIVSIDNDKKEIIMNLPEGILDVND